MADPLANLSISDLDRFTAHLSPQRRQPPPSRALIESERYRLGKLLVARECEGLRLYEPLPLAEMAHACNAMWRLFDGSNRAGKTIAATAEDARAITGQDPYDKYPKKNGFALFVGLELKHLALLYRNLFVEGAFKIITDEATKLYRAVRYDRADPSRLQAYDEAYREKWRDAPPLIPPRMVRSVQWEVAGTVPRTINFTNGWRSLWLSAKGEPDQGSHYNLVHFDEEMPNPAFYLEAHRGLTRLHETVVQRPKGIWSATSQVANVELAELREKAVSDPNSAFVRQFVFLIDNNPYFSEQAREEFRHGLNEEEMQTRYFGVAASDVRRIYPTYNPTGDSDNGSGHGCEPFEINPAKSCRVFYLDPSVRHCATLLFAIDEHEQYMTLYDAFELQGGTARMWAEEMKQREHGFKFDKGVIDQRMGNQSTMTREKATVATEYANALAEAGVQLRQTGLLQGFFPSCADVDARTHALLRMLEVRSDGPFAGTIKLRIMRGICPQLDKQVHRAQTDPRNPKKRLKNPKVPQDFLDDLEYAAADNPTYTCPEPLEAASKVAVPTVVRLFRQKEINRRKHQQAEARRRNGYFIETLQSQ